MKMVIALLLSVWAMIMAAGFLYRARARATSAGAARLLKWVEEADDVFEVTCTQCTNGVIFVGAPYQTRTPGAALALLGWRLEGPAQGIILGYAGGGRYTCPSCSGTDRLPAHRCALTLVPNDPE